MVVHYPTAHLANHAHIIVDAGDDKVGELYPYAGITHGEDGVEHGLEVSAADTLVDIIAKRFQVNVGGIKVGQQVSQWLLTDVACRDEDVPKTSLVCQSGGVDDVFYIGERLRVGVGDAWAVVLPAEGHDFFRQEAVVLDIS